MSDSTINPVPTSTNEPATPETTASSASASSVPTSSNPSPSSSSGKVFLQSWG